MARAVEHGVDHNLQLTPGKRRRGKKGGRGEKKSAFLVSEHGDGEWKGSRYGLIVI